MRALTFWPEWIPAFRWLGKTIENRTWPPPENLIGKTLALHAGASIGGGSRKRGFDWLANAAEAAGVEGLGFDRNEDGSWFATACGVMQTMPIVTGAVVGVARVVTAREDLHGVDPWAMADSRHWQLDRFGWLGRPIPCRGAQGLWILPPGVERDVRVSLQIQTTQTELWPHR